jgi:TRAP-type C4-dicarboxylate transport system substrate-binding protein
MGKQDGPAIADPFVEFDGSLGGFGGEVRAVSLMRIDIVRSSHEIQLLEPATIMLAWPFFFQAEFSYAHYLHF